MRRPVKIPGVPGGWMTPNYGHQVAPEIEEAVLAAPYPGPYVGPAGDARPPPPPPPVPIETDAQRRAREKREAASFRRMVHDAVRLVSIIPSHPSEQSDESNPTDSIG